MPDDITVPAGNKVFLVGHAVGTQNYVCLPSGDDFKFTLFTPQATLFSDDGKQVMTHYFSPNALEGDTIRATWQDSRDTSTVWAQATNLLLGPQLRRAGCDCLGPASAGWIPGRTRRRRHADGDDLRPAAEHHWRARTVDGL